MALRLAKGIGSTSETWLGQQIVYYLEQPRELQAELQVEKFVSTEMQWKRKGPDFLWESEILRWIGMVNIRGGVWAHV